ncbi:glutaredoxin-like [Raphanus sativus]|uniref:Glutaredoxin-like n=1 Tax=Raphanus sativus TaxID=3726 RepID=A0A6J0N904_RAPSA|nr:glutaredoxin-like [Raphanus sativus]KAJ4902672.1 glutaredoxin-like [Raphanus sativus]
MAMKKAKEIVSSNAVVVFSKSYCPYCVKVKDLLKKLGAKFIAVELDKESDGTQVQSALAEWTGQRTVPNVFIGGKHIGGCDSVTNLHKNRKLVPLLTVLETGSTHSKPVSRIRSNIIKIRQGDNRSTEVEGPSRARKTVHAELNTIKAKSDRRSGH